MTIADACSRAYHDRCDKDYCACPCHPDENGVIHTGRWLRDHLIKIADDWVDEALCYQTKHPDDWFPDEGSRAGTPQGALAHRAAKRVCARCPVRRECLRVALTSESKTDARRGLTGIWGGLSGEERWKPATMDLPLEERLDLLEFNFQAQIPKLLSNAEMKEMAS